MTEHTGDHGLHGYDGNHCVTDFRALLAATATASGVVTDLMASMAAMPIA